MTAQLVVKQLTPRQQEVLELIAAGCPDWEIAARLGVSDTTAKQHVLDVRTVLGARNRAHAVYLAVACGQLEVAP